MNIRGLLVDDNIEFANNLKDLALTYQIRLNHITNLRKMEEDLTESPGLFSCVILEAKCKYEQDDSISSIDYINKSLIFLTKYYVDIPYYVLTSDIEGGRFVERHWEKERLFKKSNTEIKRLFDKIKSLSSEKTKIRKSYPKVFEVIDYHRLPEGIETQLMAILSKQNSDDSDIIKENLTTARRILEALFKIINKKRKDIIPDDYLKVKGNIKFGELHKYLNGKASFNTHWEPIADVYFGGATAEMTDLIWSVGSEHGAHFSDANHCLTKYTVKSCIYALFECIIWFDKIMRNKFLPIKHNLL